MEAVFTRRVPGAADFYARWLPTRAWLFEGRNPYSAEVTRATQIGMIGRPALPGEDQLQFAYPLFSTIFVLPSAFIADFAWASALWLALLQVTLVSLVGLSLVWSRWQPAPWLFAATLLFGIFWYHTVRTLLLGQLVGVIAALLAGALVCLQQRRDRWAGLLLALTAAKPQIAFLILPALWIWAVSVKRWEFLLWSAGALAALVGGSFALLPTWLGDWVGQIPVYAATTISAPPAALAAQALLPSQARLLQILLSGGLAAYLAWTWRRAWGRDGEPFEYAVGMTLVTTCLISPRIATTDYLIMLPVLFTLFGTIADSRRRWAAGRVLALEAGLLVGLWVLFLATVQGNQEQAIMYLPLPVGLWIFLLVREVSHDKAH